MVVIIDDTLIGEAGDILISQRDYKKMYSYIPSEEIEWTPGTDGLTPVKKYVRLLGLPPIKQLSERYSILVALTMEDKLIIITKRYPQGFPLTLEIGPVKEIIDTVPMGLLDLDNTLHFLDMKSIIEQQSYYSISAPIHMSLIHEHNKIQTKNVYYGREVGGNLYRYDRELIVILTPDDTIIYGETLRIANLSASYPYKTIRPEGIDRLIGRMILYQNGNLQAYPFDPNNQIVEIDREIDYQIKDSEGFDGRAKRVRDAITLSDEISYTLDYGGVIRMYRDNTKTIIDAPFNSVRLLIRNMYKSKIQGLVEDEGGNIYILPKLKPINYPVILINNHLNQLRGRTTKRALTSRGRSSSRTIV